MVSEDWRDANDDSAEFGRRRTLFLKLWRRLYSWEKRRGLANERRRKARNQRRRRKQGERTRGMERWALDERSRRGRGTRDYSVRKRRSR
jgi:hypothetical protein